MPRLPRSLLLRARSISPFLPLLLQICRTLPSARNELRWLQEHVLDVSASRRDDYKTSQALLLHLCQRRSSGVPLQYLLGSQPFGELDILCRPGVLIPRPETEAYTTHIAKLLERDLAVSDQDGLNILDLCTDTRVLGVDISDLALKLARDNIQHNVTQGHLAPQAQNQISFLKGDVLSDFFYHGGSTDARHSIDIVVANPPYISQAGFGKDTERSVRNWEPKLALVPPAIESGIPDSPPEDIFYHKILHVARAAGARISLMEVGDTQQAIRVAQLALDAGVWGQVEIWRDWPDQEAASDGEGKEDVIGGQRVPFRGTGHGRSVYCRR